MKQEEVFRNLEKVFVILDWEAQKGKCDYRFRNSGNEYCGTFGRDVMKRCEPDNCPYVYAIVTEVKEECSEKPIYIE